MLHEAGISGLAEGKSINYHAAWQMLAVKLLNPSEADAVLARKGVSQLAPGYKLYGN